LLQAAAAAAMPRRFLLRATWPARRFDTVAPTELPRMQRATPTHRAASPLRYARVAGAMRRIDRLRLMRLA